MPKLIVGLGNPGASYSQTRHNIGYMMLDRLAEAHRVAWQEKPKFKAYIAEITLHGNKALLVKPTTFYNNSGEVVRSIKDFYKIELHDILAIHDELALPFGTIRTRQQGSDAGNNGIKSLTAHLGNAYSRIRVGIWHELRDHMPDSDYVLSKFTQA
ncbi:MAG TPA: aminoacyl-tRNA hydrolase, partial [Candidatus Saccharimonadales bacterium]